MSEPRKRSLGLQGKAILLLLAIAAVPLGVSAVLVGQIAIVASRVAEGETARLRAPLARAHEAYEEAVDARKDAFEKGARVVAASPELARLCTAHAPAAEVRATLRATLKADANLAHIALTERTVVDGVVTPVVRGVVTRQLREPMRVLSRVAPLLGAPACTVSTTWVTPRHFKEDQEALGETLKEAKTIAAVKRTLPSSYRLAFVLLVGGVVMGTTLLAIFLARTTTRRIEVLVEATRRVGEGDLEGRARLSGNDELADLSHAFDQMVTDLKKSRAEIEYLEKIGAWQEVARRLAHEIKNPLTPIQLAVQQLHTKYDGSDPRFKKLLDDAHTIVTEEVAGLRRLVDAFRGFARLPRVEPQPLDLALLVEDVGREQEIEAVPPGQAITIQGDRLLLRRAILNLVENAREAGAKRVRIGWAKHGGSARITIDDDGPGVPAELRGRLFDPYVTTKEHGTGLGLAIVKKTLLEHGGDIVLTEAPSPLGGAQFLLDLPLS